MATHDQMLAAVSAMHNAAERWRYHQVGDDFIVMDVPPTRRGNSPTSAPETVTLWRFDNKPAARRFRGVKIMEAVMAKLGVAVQPREYEIADGRD